MHGNDSIYFLQGFGNGSMVADILSASCVERLRERNCVPFMRDKKQIH